MTILLHVLRHRAVRWYSGAASRNAVAGCRSAGWFFSSAVAADEGAAFLLYAGERQRSAGACPASPQSITMHILFARGRTAELKRNRGTPRYVPTYPTYTPVPVFLSAAPYLYTFFSTFLCACCPPLCLAASWERRITAFVLSLRPASTPPSDAADIATAALFFGGNGLRAASAGRWQALGRMKPQH